MSEWHWIMVRMAAWSWLTFSAGMGLWWLSRGGSLGVLFGVTL